MIVTWFPNADAPFMVTNVPTGAAVGVGLIFAALIQETGLNVFTLVT
jgi:hypothetical protein